MRNIYSDEQQRLSDEISGLMQRAADEAMRREFGEYDAEVSVTIVGGEEIRELNRDYRGIDRVTDVLSFPQFEADELEEVLKEESENAPENDAEGETADFEPVLIGDVVICYDRAAEQAEEYGTGLTRELVYLFVHSIFHLFGYDHEEEEERKAMRGREEEVLAAIGVMR
jgi:probable rRNA maturation factor